MNENQQANEVGGLVRGHMLDTMVIRAKLRMDHRRTTQVPTLKDAAASQLKVLYTAEDLMAFFGCQQ